MQGATPLHVAAANAASALVQKLVEAGADVTMSDAEVSEGLYCRMLVLAHPVSCMWCAG